MGRKLGGKSLLEIVVRRLTECQQLDRVVVLPGEGVSSDDLRDLVPPDVAVFDSTEGDLLSRYIAAADAHEADAVVRVTSENTFLDPAFVDRLITTGRQHPACDYISYQCRDGLPAVLSPLGVFAEWCRTAALREADRQAKPAEVRQAVTRWIYSHPECFQLRLMPLPEAMYQGDLRLSIDSEEDWERTVALFDAWGQEDFDWRRIAGSWA